MEEAACQQHFFPSRHQWRGFSEQILMNTMLELFAAHRYATVRERMP
ncbi:hypothetical protein LL998_27765 [Burkholderia ambifaria]|nr:hypothetical protein [Burkholderia ambifaria]UEP37427.1 hypothetical protein LL998_27765 [Burkholderia ambifaria]